MLKGNKVIIVLGMHRSGTSLITRAINSMGVGLGNNLMKESFDNPKGFFEDKKIMYFNDVLLNLRGGNWYSLFAERAMDDCSCVERVQAEALQYLDYNFAKEEVWAFKDPRTCLLLPFWLALLKACDCEVKLLVVVRSPRSVVQSLYRREMILEVDGYHLYNQYMLGMAYGLRREDFCVIDYDDFLENPGGSYKKIALSLELKYSDSRCRDFVEVFLDRNLRHNKPAAGIEDRPVAILAESLFSTIRSSLINHISDEQWADYEERHYQSIGLATREVARELDSLKALYLYLSGKVFRFRRHIKFLGLPPIMLLRSILRSFRQPRAFFNLHDRNCHRHKPK